MGVYHLGVVVSSGSMKYLHSDAAVEEGEVAEKTCRDGAMDGNVGSAGGEVEITKLGTEHHLSVMRRRRFEP